MPAYKVQCQNPNRLCAPTAYGNVKLEPWEDHPALKTALDCLNVYNHWVSQRLIPIAFQWIQEHYEDVYRNMPPQKREDMGAVVASAFDLVRREPKYNDGLALADAIAKGEIDPSHSNPHWAGVARGLSDKLNQAFTQHEIELADMLVQMRPEALSPVE